VHRRVSGDFYLHTSASPLALFLFSFALSLASRLKMEHHSKIPRGNLPNVTNIISRPVSSEDCSGSTKLSYQGRTRRYDKSQLSDQASHCISSDVWCECSDFQLCCRRSLPFALGFAAASISAGLEFQYIPKLPFERVRFLLATKLRTVTSSPRIF
jgi:hypothetical protein